MEVREISWDEYEEIAARHSAAVPIEQTRQWADYQSTIPGREPWGCLVLCEGQDEVAVVSLIDYETHGYHYLRAHHGPVWFVDATEEMEQRGLDALVRYVRDYDKRQVFMRLAVDAELKLSHATLSSIPYDTTVVIDVTGGDEAILSRMKPRGRRDVRKALREAPITCADETERALRSFDEYYAIMTETAHRDGFAPAPQADYERMLNLLGTERCRLFAGRLENGEVCTWSLCTISGTRATRYYAASSNATRRGHVTDKLCYFECCELGRSGCTEYDLMAIGSDFSPRLNGLNEFKTKFTKEVTHVAPDRDIPVRRTFYRLLGCAKAGATRVRSMGARRGR